MYNHVLVIFYPHTNIFSLASKVPIIVLLINNKVVRATLNNPIHKSRFVNKLWFGMNQTFPNSFIDDVWSVKPKDFGIKCGVPSMYEEGEAGIYSVDLVEGEIPHPIVSSNSSSKNRGVFDDILLNEENLCVSPSLVDCDLDSEDVAQNTITSDTALTSYVAGGSWCFP